MFITFEGGEGSGKSTHARLLSERLSAVLTHEPGGTAVGKLIREALLNRESELEAMSEIFLFAADRVEHMEKVILPALHAKKIVISDRFLDSTIAYQLAGRGLPEDLVRYVNWVSCRGTIPDLTFYLDVPVKEGLLRAQKRGAADRFEAEILAFHERVRDKYLEIARDNPERVKVIESVGSIDEVQARIRKLI
ncbi:dTMP kinase [Candidatus Saganbacteria bacterium]|nr:dTMP kinase [Candidatus Saganbacteria bacterium]